MFRVPVLPGIFIVGLAILAIVLAGCSGDSGDSSPAAMSDATADMPSPTEKEPVSPEVITQNTLETVQQDDPADPTPQNTPDEIQPPDPTNPEPQNSPTVTQQGDTAGLAPQGEPDDTGDTDTTPDADPQDIIFLHHSTGNNIWNGGVKAWVNNYNSQNGTQYNISERDFPTDAYGWQNYPYDYWNIWVNHAGDSAFSGQPTLEMLTKDYDVIIWKHCYPGSNVLADTGNPSISSSRKSIENYKLQYNALKEKMHQFPDTTFIVWTGAAQTQANTNQANAQRAREFFNWVIGTWDVPGDNIYIWDFRQLETEGGLYLLSKNAVSATNSHPNSTFSEKVAPYFGQRIVDVIEGKGDSTSLTGTGAQ